MHKLLMRQHQPLLKQTAGFLRPQMLQIALKRLDRFIEIREKRLVFRRQILLLAVQLIVQRRLQMFGGIDRRIMGQDHIGAQRRQLPELKQRIQIHTRHHDNDDEAR